MQGTHWIVEATHLKIDGQEVFAWPGRTTMDKTDLPQ